MKNPRSVRVCAAGRNDQAVTRDVEGTPNGTNALQRRSSRRSTSRAPGRWGVCAGGGCRRQLFAGVTTRTVGPGTWLTAVIAGGRKWLL